MPTIFSRGAASALALGFGKVSSILTDSFFKYVTLLLPGNGTNAAQNNTFLDSSSNNFTITRNGNTTQGTFSPYGSNWSMNTSVTGSYLTIPQNTAFAFGTGNFTIEAWVMRNEASRQQGIVDTRGAGSGAVGVLFYLTAQGYLAAFDGTSTYIGGTVATVMPGYQANGLWTHVAITRSGTTTRLFINGTIVATLAGDTRNYANGASGTLIARQFGSTANDWIGWISNVRIVKGTALYTANFTPSTTPLTAVSGTSLLTCQSNRFVDNSGNNFTITPTGTPSVQRYSPFSPTASYSAATVGGSGYFDGTGDNLVSAASATLGLGSGNFTFEGWFYRTATGDKYLLDYAPEATNRLSVLIRTNTLQTYDTGYHDSGLTVVLNQWNHFAYVRNGTTITPYLNGVAGTTYTDSRNLAKTATWYIASDDTNLQNLTGYMTDVRVVVGTAVYTSTFTPPTSPLTAISGTQLLCNMTNAGIIDNAMMNDLETAGNAQISTAQSKFGGSSMYFDGTGDYLQSVNSTALQFGTSDFTIECWVYVSAFATGTAAILSKRTGSAVDGTWQIDFAANTGNLRYQILNVTGGVITVSIGTVTLNTWNHVAVSKQSGTTRTYLNGVAGGTTANTTAINGSTYPLVVGAGDTTGATNYLNGYIDDLRITRGYARYTTAFTPPTEAFPTL